MKIISVRKNPEYAPAAIAYFQRQWASEESKMVYQDSITSCLASDAPLPQWFLLYNEAAIIGCVGIITNDFISRMDLWPWLCALYIEEDHRGNGYGALLIAKVKESVKAMGYHDLYLCTDHVGYYEKYGFDYLADGYHPWGECSRIYHSGPF